MSETTAPVAPPIEELPPVNEMTDEQLQQHFQLQTADMSHGAVAAAQDHAAEDINRQIEAGHNFVSRFLRRVWHGNIAKDYYTAAAQIRGRDDVAHSGNIHSLHNGTLDDHNATAAAVIERVTGGFMRDDEEQRELSTISNGSQLESNLKDLVKSFARGDIDTEDALNEQKTRVLQEFGRGLRREDRNKGLALADNVVEVALNARAALRHGLGTDRIDAAIDASSAQHADVKMGARTEAHFNKVDSVVDKLYKSRIGSLVNETTLAAAISIPFVAGKFATRKLAIAAGATVGLGVGSGILAGVRESFHIKQDRRTHTREMAVGGADALSHAGKKRERLEATRYETVAAQELLVNLGRARDTAAVDTDSLRNAVDSLTRASTLNRLSDERNADFIQYSSRLTVEQERLQIDIAIAEAKVAVREALRDADDQKLTDIEAETRDVDELIEARSAGIIEAVDRDVSSRDQAFRSLQRKSVLKAAVLGAVTSEIVGLGIQEAKAGLEDSLRGVFEGQHDGQTHRTVLAAAFRHSTASHEMGTNTSQQHLTDVNQRTQVKVPDGYKLLQEDGNWQLTDSHNNVVDGDVGFNEQGQFSDATKHSLEAKGFSFAEHANAVHDPDTTIYSDVHKTPTELIRDHPDQFTHVHRELWYDNDTPNIYDDNELNLWWGGHEGTGIDKHGNYVFSVAHMRPDGSFEGNVSANAQHLIREGKMNIALSMTRGTQDHVLLVHVNGHGQAVINGQSPAGKGLFTNHNGHARFEGAYAEAVQLGEVHHGVQSMRMLATVVGENHVKTIVDQVPHIVHHSHELLTTTLTPPAETSSSIEIPGAIPVVARRGLEYAEGEAVNGSEAYGYYANAYNPESIARYDRYRSPRLEADPNARLNTGEEIDWYRQQINQEPDGNDYLRSIDDIVQNTPELQTFSPNTKALICIPVGATSEADNIYNTLSLYHQQPDEAKANAKILLHVNWFDDAVNDPQKAQNITKTLSEIERAKADFPELSIADFQTVWDRNTYGSDGIIYHVVNKLYDTALAGIYDAVQSGKVTSDHEVLIIRNDADSRGMARNYIGRELLAADNHPEADAFVAATRQGTEQHKKYPGFGVVSNMREVLDQTKSLLKKPVSTIGTNSAFRASTLAAIGSIRRDDGYHGAGSDDLEIGNRIYYARLPGYTTARSSQIQNGYGYATPSDNTGADDARQANVRQRVIRYVTRNYRPEPIAGLPTDVQPPIRYVTAAKIDASPDRLLNTYRSFRPITESWSDFDAGGHTDRTEVGRGSIKLNGESVNIVEGTARRIEKNYTAMFNVWGGRDPDVIRTALNLAHGQDESVYKLTWNRDGSCEFKFTDQGLVWLKDKLTRDGYGRKDHFGDRVRRQQYHEVSRFSRLRPASRRPPMVKPVTI